MAHPIQSSFTRFHLTDEEQVQANSLTSLNICNIQNLICSAAEEKLALKFDPSNPLAFAQREAELQGQIGILRYLLELSQVSFPSHAITTPTESPNQGN